MVTNETVSKLQDMHLSTMARRFKEQLDNPQMKAAGQSTDERAFL